MIDAKAGGFTLIETKGFLLEGYERGTYSNRTIEFHQRSDGGTVFLPLACILHQEDKAMRAQSMAASRQKK
jgi:hypothetical protein